MPLRPLRLALSRVLLAAAALGALVAAPSAARVGATESMRPSVLDATTAEVLEARLRQFMAERRIPGLAVAVGTSAGVVWSAALGVADLDTQAPITLESVFPLGSTSKPLTARLLGQLVEEGRIDLDAPIQELVPDFPAKGSPEASSSAAGRPGGRVTARLLAGHLAGLRDYDHAAGEYHNQRHFSSVREAVGVFADDPLLFEPGTRYAYSPYGFVLLSAAIEGATGRYFLSVLETRLAKPLGLKRTGPNRGPPENVVTSYTTGFRGDVVPAQIGDPSIKWAAGGLVSTPLEMVRLGGAVLAGKVVRPETFVLLTTPQRLADGTDSGAGYALGWRRGERQMQDGRIVPVVHHGGTGPGSMSFFAIYPTEGVVVSLNANLLFQPFGPFAEEAFSIAEAVIAAGRTR